jgi:hypothetical protein
MMTCIHPKTVLIIALAAALMGCAKQDSTPKDSISVAHNELAKFYNFSTVDWELIDTLYYRPYNCDWPEEMEQLFNKDFPFEFIPAYWHNLQNAKTYLHQQTLPLRIGASDEAIAQLNRTEAALDSVFVRMVSDVYYLRNFVDSYEEIMPQQVTRCFETLDAK